MDDNLINLNLKDPEAGYEVKSKYFCLTPTQYADFIETGLKLLPNLKAVLKKRKENIPQVKFKL